MFRCRDYVVFGGDSNGKLGKHLGALIKKCWKMKSEFETVIVKWTFPSGKSEQILTCRLFSTVGSMTLSIFFMSSNIAERMKLIDKLTETNTRRRVQPALKPLHCFTLVSTVLSSAPVCGRRRLRTTLRGSKSRFQFAQIFQYQRLF